MTKCTSVYGNWADENAMIRAFPLQLSRIFNDYIFRFSRFMLIRFELKWNSSTLSTDEEISKVHVSLSMLQRSFNKSSVALHIITIWCIDFSLRLYCEPLLFMLAQQQLSCENKKRRIEWAAEEKLMFAYGKPSQVTTTTNICCTGWRGETRVGGGGNKMEVQECMRCFYEAFVCLRFSAVFCLLNLENRRMM